MKFKKLELDEEILRDLTPAELGDVSGGTRTGGWVCWSIQISIAICPTGGCSGGSDPTIGGETYTCMC